MKFTEMSELNKSFFTQYYTGNETLNVSRIIKKDEDFKSWTKRVAYIKNMPIYENEDIYFSVNSIKNGTKRCQYNVESLNWCFADLDVFHNSSKFSNKSAEEVYAQIKMMFDETIPYPTVVIFSGRGFYLLWKLVSGHNENARNFISIKAQKRWKRINKRLNSLLCDFYSDEKIAGDTARILRIPGSFNTKCGFMVNVIHSNPDYTYTLDELDNFMHGTKYATDEQYQLLDNIQDFYNDKTPVFYRRDVNMHIKDHYIKYRHDKYGMASREQQEFCADLAKKNGVRLPNNTKYYHEADKFIRKYYKPDFITLRCGSDAMKSQQYEYGNVNLDDPYFKMYRKRMMVIEDNVAKHPEQTGYRENILFVYRYYSCLILGDKEQAVDKVLELNSKFETPLSGKEVLCATKSAERYASDKRYKMTTAVFCAKTGIDVEEYHSFNTYRRKPTNKKDKSETNRAYYKKKLEENGKLEKKEAVRIRRIMVDHYYSKGKTINEIAALTGVGASTIRRDVKAIKLEKAKSLALSAKDYIKKNTLAVRNKIVESISKTIKIKCMGGFYNLKEKYSKNSVRKVLYVLCTTRERIARVTLSSPQMFTYRFIQPDRTVPDG